MPSHHYTRTREILSTIVAFLATAKGDMRERLKIMSVEISQLTTDDFPSSLKNKWDFVETKLSKYPAKFNWNQSRQEMGSIEHSLSRMHNRTACKIAQNIYELYEEFHFGNYQSA